MATTDRRRRRLPSARESDLARLLRQPGYAYFALTVGMLRLTTAMFVTAGALFVLRRTGSPAVAGVTVAAATLPAAVTGPFLGAWLEVARSRRALIVADQLICAGALIGLVLAAGRAPNWTLALIAIPYSLTSPLSTGSFQSSLAEIVGPELLEPAGRMESVSMNSVFVIGPALAGGLVGLSSPTLVLLAQAGIGLVIAIAVAVNPVFEARQPQRAESARHAIREGTRALAGRPALRALGLSSMLANFGWGLMAVGFPLYVTRILHSPAHSSGFLWTALAAGSLLGTFVLRGRASPRRSARSYFTLGLSVVLWPLAGSLGIGLLLVAFTGFLEGPAFSGAFAIRQLNTPPTVRAQVATTIGSANLMAFAAGQVMTGVLGSTTVAFVALTIANLLAAALLWRVPAAAPEAVADVV